MRISWPQWLSLSYWFGSTKPSTSPHTEDPQSYGLHIALPPLNIRKYPQLQYISTMCNVTQIQLRACQKGLDILVEKEHEDTTDACAEAYIEIIKRCGNKATPAHLLALSANIFGMRLVDSSWNQVDALVEPFIEAINDGASGRQLAEAIIAAIKRHAPE